MAEPVPGKLHRQGTFGSVVRRAIAVQKFTSAMLRSIRRKRENGVQNTPDTPMKPLPPQALTPENDIRDVSWDDVAREIQTAGDKHVLVYFYSPRVRSFYKLS
jgi:hypothetical protein